MHGAAASRNPLGPTTTGEDVENGFRCLWATYREDHRELE